jgi:cellulose synthase/poly-beta-1,6-N-acetylglucosamine synthase-like glycosyltransferase
VNQAPRISVLISSFKNARFVAKKLAEIRAQTAFADAEFLFIETGSPERERDLFEPFCREHTNCRLITTDERKTLYQAWNVGWRDARAPLICYTNMDDAMHPDLLAAVLREFDAATTDVCTVLIAKQPMDDAWNSWSREHVTSLPLSTRPGPFTAWRTNLRATLGEFDERFMAAGDKEFWHRIVHKNLRVELIPKILYLYTKNPGSLSVEARQSERWQKEKALLRDMKLTWPASLRWQVRTARVRRAIQPSFGYVPVEGA